MKKAPALALAASLLSLLLATPAVAQDTAQPAWDQLPAADRELLLQPVRERWNNADAAQRARMLEHARRWRDMPPEQRARAHVGMRRFDKLTPEQQAQAREKAFRAPLLLLAVVRLRDEDAEIEPHERIVSAGCALQNVLLMAHALGFGGALTSGKALASAPLRRLFDLHDDEQALCFVNIGTVVSTMNDSAVALDEIAEEIFEGLGDALALVLCGVLFAAGVLAARRGRSVVASARPAAAWTTP